MAWKFPGPGKIQGPWKFQVPLEISRSPGNFQGGPLFHFGQAVAHYRLNQKVQPSIPLPLVTLSSSSIIMGLEWRGPHRTLLVRLLHYVWIHIHYVNVDGNDRALKLRCWMHLVPPYYGAPQTKPGVQYNNDERNVQYLQYFKAKQDIRIRTWYKDKKTDK